MSGTKRGKVATELRQDEALALWVKGKTYAQVADELGYANKAGAYKAVQAALARHQVESETLAENGRALALERLRPLWHKAMELVESPDASSKDVLAAAQIADRMARYEGVRDPATEVRLTVEAELDRDIATLTAALTAALGDQRGAGDQRAAS